jgi:hypothetical protein
MNRGGMIENFIFTGAELDQAYDRAQRNKEDCLDRSLISLLLD